MLTTAVKPTIHRPTMQFTLRVTYYLLLMAGLVALGYAGGVVAISHRHQASESAWFEKAVNRDAVSSPSVSSSSSSTPVAASVGARTSNVVVGRLEIPRIGIRVIVDEGITDSVLSRAVGHVPQTALPGELGNVVLAGHRDTFFRELRKVEPGDKVKLETVNSDFDYQVTEIAIVSATDIRLLKPTEQPMLTLVTCYPFHYVGPAPKRFIVQARLISSSEDPAEID
jgi:sortase A